MFGRKKCAQAERRQQIAAAAEELAGHHFDAYQRTGDPERLAAYRIHKLGGEADRRGLDSIDDLPQSLKRQWRWEESKAVFNAAEAERERNRRR